MKFYTIKTPTVIQKLFSNYRWRFSSVPKEIYLTFDDGPTLEVTNFVLEELKKHQAKATFFCIGKNVKKHQNIYHKIQEEGHSLGNHTYNHLNGLLTKNTRYIENTQQASVQQEGYKIIMWDVLSGDFDRSISPEKCLENVLKNATNGSIIVMHDSEKAKDKIYFALPRILDHFSQKGYLFKAIV